MESSENAKNKDVKAPMPGMVLNILVGEGDLVEKDAPLVILEAMKMENELRTATGGIVESIHVKAGDTKVIDPLASAPPKAPNMGR